MGLVFFSQVFVMLFFFLLLDFLLVDLGLELENKSFSSLVKQYIVHILLYICNLDSVLSSVVTNR